MCQSFANLKALRYYPYGPIEGQPVDTAARLSAMLSGSVPEDYLSFLREFPNTGMFDIDGTVGIGAFGLDMLFASCADKRCDLVEIASRPVYEGDMPRDFLMIGDNGFGNAFGLDLRPGTFGRVFYWDHDDGALHLVAPSFSEFVINLRAID
jgi:hypothetical protein